MPHRESIMNGYAIKSVIGFRISVIRSIPYPLVLVELLQGLWSLRWGLLREL